LTDQTPRLGEDEGRRALLVGGVVQSVAVEADDGAGGVWAALLPAVRPRRALVLGLGGGTVVRLLHRRFGPVQVVGVERDARVLALAEAAFGLDLPGLEIVREDAFTFVARCSERFDYLCVDLYQGAELQRGILARPFLRRLKSLATPGAEIAINLFRDRRAEQHVQRIGRVLTVRATERVGQNLVVKAGVR
jgi:spermidine synthase